jgi:hypothetical protein
LVNISVRCPATAVTLAADFAASRRAPDGYHQPMRACHLAVAGGLLTALAAACGDDAGGGPDPQLPDGPGRFDTPSEFDHSACKDESLAGISPAGIYQFTLDYDDGFHGSGAARFDVGAAGEVTGVLTGSDAARGWANDDEYFLWRQAGETDQSSRSLLLCARDGDILTGQYAVCRDGEACLLARVRGTRLERQDGEAEASNLTMIGQYDVTDDASWDLGVGLNVRVADDVAYLVRGRDGLRIVDVADPAAPVELAHVPGLDPVGEPGAEYLNDVKVFDAAGGRRHALVASNVYGVWSVDVTDPRQPVRGPSFGTVGESVVRVHTLAIVGTRAYLANLELGLEIWDIANPLAPVKLGQFFPANAPDGAFLHDLYVEGDRAYLDFWTAGMVIADVSDPAAVREVGRFADYGEHTNHSSWVTTIGDRRVAVTGDEEYGAHLHVVDVTEGTAGFGQEIGTWQTRPEVSIHNLMAFGDEVILSHYQDGIRILDLSDPADPRTTAWYNTWKGYGEAATLGYGYSFFDGAIGVDVDQARGRIYVADSARGLIILQR